MPPAPQLHTTCFNSLVTIQLALARHWWLQQIPLKSVPVFVLTFAWRCGGYVLRVLLSGDAVSGLTADVQVGNGLCGMHGGFGTCANKDCLEVAQSKGLCTIHAGQKLCPFALCLPCLCSSPFQIPLVT